MCAWDLSDQDSDSMLSLREFCIALYLMERYREGQNLPPTLPSNVLLDETLLSLTGPPNPILLIDMLVGELIL
ncbi:epidermal growth factor receptor substrate 15-like protein 1, partial [Tanacetum coccineum]